jgi:nitroreductase
MELWLAIASRREVRDYADTPIADDVQRRILDAGRLSESLELRERLADLVYEPTNIRGAQLVVAVAVRGKGPVSLDTGRCAQNMLLTAWDQGVGASPNGMPDRAAVAELLGLREGEEPAIVLSFGYPATPRDPSSRTPEEWSARARRKSLDELVEHV